MGDHPAKENRDTNELTDLIFDPPLKDVSKFLLHVVVYNFIVCWWFVFNHVKLVDFNLLLLLLLLKLV